MKKFFKALFIHATFFYALLGIITVFVFSYFFPVLYTFSWALLFILILLTIIDVLLVFSPHKAIVASRLVPDRFSNSDENEVQIFVENNYTFRIKIEVIDELPLQFQLRNFLIKSAVLPQQNLRFTYSVRPTERGIYQFGGLNIYVQSPLQLIAKKWVFDAAKNVATYPSFIQLKKYEFLAFSNQLTQFGFKKIRKIGHALEFEQIKEYVHGEDIRNINWKATAKKNSFMVNQYQDEKAQPVYCIMDKGRTMRMPFEGLSLLDYAINSTLVLSNIILRKQDKVGMFTFSKDIENKLPAEKKPTQLHKILEALYAIQTDFIESDFNRLYVEVKKSINQRSLLIVYTNFETVEGLHRQLPYLKAIARMHMVLLVFFENTELTKITQEKSETLPDIFDKTIARKFNYEKRLIVKELKKYGIQSLLTKPENLTVDTINKYLEIKARGLI